MNCRWAALLVLLGGCAHGIPASIAESPDGQTSSDDGARRTAPSRTPLLDHHQHLLSEGGRRIVLDLTDGWPSPEIDLAPDFRHLLEARQAAWSNAGALASILHEDAVFLSAGGRWLSGRGPVSERLSRTFLQPVRMLPIAASRIGDAGYIAGYYAIGDGADLTYVGYFHLDVVRSEGEWSILGEVPRFPGPPYEPLVDADQLVEMLDSAGIPRALVFSNAYSFARGPIEQPGEMAQVSAENDWTLAQTRRHPGRLFVACSVNPLRAYAVAELERCAAIEDFRALKLHFDASSVDLRNPVHVESVRTVFMAANDLRMPLIVHLQSEAGSAADQARIFLNDILPAAPDVPVTINHLWGGGVYVQESADALAVFADAAEHHDPRTRNLWFDLAQISMAARTDEDRAAIVASMRRIGFSRLLYGSDGPQWSGETPDRVWEHFSEQMPLTAEELDVIATNVAPYLIEDAD